MTEHASSGLVEALGDVVVSTKDRDTIATERLLWDRRKHIFYTDLYARIVRDGDVMMPRKGFEADENFRWYNLFTARGYQYRGFPEPGRSCSNRLIIVYLHRFSVSS